MEFSSVPYSFLKDGIYYFARRIPADLAHHYDAKKISYSLRTRSPKLAAKRALIAASQLDEYWDRLRDDDGTVPLQHLSVTDRKRQAVVKTPATDLGPTITDAVANYLRLKDNNRPKTFSAGVHRASKYLIEACGDKKIGLLTKVDATSFRDTLFERGLSGSSVARVFGTTKSVINFAINEAGLEMTNPFKDVFFDRELGVTKRNPISTDGIRKIQNACQQEDDDLRWLVALVSDTGMRLAEAVGMHIDDFCLDQDIPFVRIRPHPWRRLKTKSSKRDVPLVGASLWAATRITLQAESDYAFPRYIKDQTANANSASAALNKWLRDIVGEGFSMHSFRHSFRDRLREVGCPAELIDQLGGWSRSANVGQSYGAGYSMNAANDWLRLISLKVS